MSDYFSDRENGPRARTEQTISPVVWAGLVALVQGLLNSGAFGLRFPERCPDGQAICGCDTASLAAAHTPANPRHAMPRETHPPRLVTAHPHGNHPPPRVEPGMPQGPAPAGGRKGRAY